MDLRNFHPIRNLSLKWSFFLYALVGIFIALLLSMLLNMLFSNLSADILNYYEVKFRDEMADYAALTASDGTVLQGGIWLYSEPLDSRFTKEDKFLYDLYNVLSIVIIPIIWIICIVTVGILFYIRKLKKPLNILDMASTRIAEGDLSFTPVYENRNEFGRLAVSFEKMRSTLLETNKEMWRMIENRRRLNSAFAHDLRTPLTVLRGYGDFLLRYIPEGRIDDKKTLDTLSIMNLYITRLEGYTETMSSLQKLEDMKLTPSDISFETLCSDIRSAAELMAGEKRLDFNAAGSGIINMDPAAIARVCDNLISNAVRYAESFVSIRCNIESGFLIVTVKDDGPGFSKEALKHASEPFYRDETSCDEKETGKAQHFGIGLYISKLLCEKHGGGLAISNNGGGEARASLREIENNE